MKTAISPRLNQFLRDESGGPIVELALIVPLLSLLTFGMIEFGYLLYQQHIVTKGVQEAARFVARSPAITEGGTCPPSGGALSAITGAAANIATSGRASGGTTRLTNFTPSTLSISVSCAAGGGLITSTPVGGGIPVVTVVADVPAASTGFLSFLPIAPIGLEAQHQEMGVGL